MGDLSRTTIHELSALLQKREVSSVEATKAVLRRIRETNDRLNSYLLVCEEEALSAAAEADRRIGKGEADSPLAGIPVAVKDILCTKGIRTTCASRILTDFVPPYDATAVRRLRDAGAVIVGKTNLDEFAMGSSTENSAFGATRNPWDLERIPGGSSGGSASAVAADQAVAALGTDTGGSIRQPASHCGVVGMKPTYGRVSRYGVIAYASSLDQVGPMTKDVTDCAIVLRTIAGHDSCDSTSIPADVPDYLEGLDAGAKGLTLGVPKEYFVEGTDPEVERAVRQGIESLAGDGAKIEEIRLPHTPYAVADYYLVATAEASSNLARYDGVKYGFRAAGKKNLLGMYLETRAKGFGAEVKRRIMLGTFALSSGYYDAYYLKAQRVRTLIRRDFEDALARCDVILTPVAPTAAFRIGEKIDDPLQMYLSDIFTLSVNLAGLPALAIPCGATSSGLPIGLQMIGRQLDEATLLRVGRAFEIASGWERRRPPI